MPKTFLIPLFKDKVFNIKAKILELAPLWNDVEVAFFATYLAMMVGPEREQHSWSKATTKYCDSFNTWRACNMGIHLNIRACNTYSAALLSFIMQAEDLPPKRPRA